MAREEQLSAEMEEQECIALAYKQAKEMLKAGTAPPSIVTHFLQKGSQGEQQQIRKRQAEINVLDAKAENLSENTGESDLYRQVINAMKSYEYDPNGE